MNSLRRKVIIVLLSLVAFAGAGISAVYVFEKRKAYVERKSMSVKSLPWIKYHEKRRW